MHLHISKDVRTVWIMRHPERPSANQSKVSASFRSTRAQSEREIYLHLSILLYTECLQYSKSHMPNLLILFNRFDSLLKMTKYQRIRTKVTTIITYITIAITIIIHISQYRLINVSLENHIFESLVVANWGKCIVCEVSGSVKYTAYESKSFDAIIIAY